MDLKKRRLDRGWSQEHMADVCGLSARTIQRIEKGEKAGLETLNALAAGFGISSSELRMEKSGNEKQENMEDMNGKFIPKHWRGFIVHLITFMAVATWLLGLNYSFEMDSEWPGWIAYMWGTVVLIHAISLIGQPKG